MVSKRNLIKPSKQLWLQVAVALIVIAVLGVLINNITVNLIRTGLGLSFSWLSRSAGFALGEHPLPYDPSDSYAWALFIGWLNSLKVILSSLLLATLIGVAAGAARIGQNALLRALSAGYVALIRQVPLLLQLLFWYFVGFLSLSETPLAPLGGLIQLSNQGIALLGVRLSVEFSALMVGLSVFTGAYIAEVVRGGLNSVHHGQWEAYRSLGLPEGIGLRRVVIPQALPAIIPGLTSQYLNLAKNSTLAIAVGYADLYAVSDTTITQTGRAIEGFLLLLLSFLLLNLLISSGMGALNRLVLQSQQPN
ncbi:MAG: ABC transporter permease subunit [Prochlorococcus sp.]|nr:ABC transporter permease subunit [Prochlorococcaceae cyanobacterium Fu_MAG_50]